MWLSAIRGLAAPRLQALRQGSIASPGFWLNPAVPLWRTIPFIRRQGEIRQVRIPTDQDIAMVIVFDLDDTLYEELSFVRSGFRAVG